jgi:Mg2+-importing ATPase
LAWLNSHFQSGLRSPLDAALLEAAPAIEVGSTKIDELPFDFQRRRVSVTVESEGRRRLITKGAPEDVLALATHYEEPGTAEPLPLDDAARARAEATFQQLSADGFRALGVGYRPFEGVGRLSLADESDLIFAGFAVFFDPPKQSAGAAIAALAATASQSRSSAATTSASPSMSAVS